MENKDTYSYDLMKRLSFTRFGGTEQELQAAHILVHEVEALGGSARLMEFEIPAYEMEHFSMTVTAPFCREIPCKAMGRSGSLPQGGVDLSLQYVELNSPAGFLGLDDLSSCAVLVNSLDLDMYRELIKRKAAAVIVIASDKWYQDDQTTDLIAWQIRDHMLALGTIPAFTLRSRDAMALVRDGASSVHLELRQHDTKHLSRNVIAEIPGQTSEKEWVVLTAHYDSVTLGTGSWDNATGSATLLYIYRHFLLHPPKRSMRFIWCGSEEQGLLGSKAYIAQNENELEAIRFCFNFDMCGTILGTNSLHITGNEELKAVCQQLCDEYGYAATLKREVHSSDSAPFCDHGIPAVGLSRYARSGSIHNRYDLDPILSQAQLEKNGTFAVYFITRLVNSAVFPVKREMPEDMKQELDKYFRRDKAEA